MIEVRYVSSNRKEYNLIGDKMRPTSGVFHDYEWDPETVSQKMGDKVTGFTKKAKTYSLTLTVRGKLEERKSLIDELTNEFEHDIINITPGRIFFGGWYIDCYIKNKTTGISGTWNNWTELSVGAYCPYPFWIRETPYYFKAAEITSTNNKRYAGRYAYRYANGLNNTYIINDHYAESNFRMVIYGPCVKPSVYIGGYEYHVDITLEAGEYLEIDSAAETVTKYMVSGIRVNAFNNRSFQNNIFRPIQPGQQDISWDGSFDFDLILFEERSEPRWS